MSSAASEILTNPAAASSAIAALPTSDRALASSLLSSARDVQGIATGSTEAGPSNVGAAVRVSGFGVAVSAVFVAALGGAAVLL